MDIPLGDDAFSITLPGIPNTKLRPRFSKRKGKVITYNSQSEEEETVGWRLRSRIGTKKPFEGPIIVSTIFVFAWPKSWPKKKRPTHHMSKPDIDNLIKWIGDVGNGILWHDDRQIVEWWASKLYGEEPTTIITVSRMGLNE